MKKVENSFHEDDLFLHDTRQVRVGESNDMHKMQLQGRATKRWIQNCRIANKGRETGQELG